MRCTDLHHDLELFALGALAPEQEAEIRAHLNGCAECRDAADDCRRLVEDIQRCAAPERPRPAFEHALRAAVAAETGRERRRRRVRRVLAVAGSVAALLLLSLSVWRAKGPEAGPPHALQEKWRYASASAYPTSVSDGVVVRGGTVYALHRDDAGPHVVAIDAATGAARWRAESRSAGYLAADDVRVFSLSSTRPRSAAMAALDAQSGRELWRYAPGDSHPLRVPCRPLPVSGGRVCWTVGGAVHMLDAATGTRIWRRAIGGEGPLSRPVACDGRLYVATGKTLRCLAADSGEPVWTEPLETPTRGLERPQLAVAGDRITLAQAARGSASRLSCMDVKTRETLWTRTVPRTRWLLAAGENIYLRGERIHALDGRSGAPLWERAAAGCGPLTHMDGRIYFIDVARSGALVVLDRRTGAKAWEFAGIRSCDAFTHVGSMGYVRTLDGAVHAFALRAPERS